MPVPSIELLQAKNNKILGELAGREIFCKINKKNEFLFVSDIFRWIAETEESENIISGYFPYYSIHQQLLYFHPNFDTFVYKNKKNVLSNDNMLRFEEKMQHIYRSILNTTSAPQTKFDYDFIASILKYLRFPLQKAFLKQMKSYVVKYKREKNPFPELAKFYFEEYFQL